MLAEVVRSSGRDAGPAVLFLDAEDSEAHPGIVASFFGVSEIPYSLRFCLHHPNPRGGVAGQNLHSPAGRLPTTAPPGVSRRAPPGRLPTGPAGASPDGPRRGVSRRAPPGAPCRRPGHNPDHALSLVQRPALCRRSRHSRAWLHRPPSRPYSPSPPTGATRAVRPAGFRVPRGRLGTGM